MCARQAEWVATEQQAVPKTFKYKLVPTLAQERGLERVLGLCRYLYYTALEQRIDAYQRRHVAKSIQDAGWSNFLSILSFKAVCAGRSVVAVPPAYTSQLYSSCGAVAQKGLS